MHSFIHSKVTLNEAKTLASRLSPTPEDRGRGRGQYFEALADSLASRP